MGIVIRQGFWGLAMVYTGVVVGYISTLIAFPAIMEIEEIGLLRLIQSNGLMLAPLAACGMPSTWIQIFPKLSDSGKDKSETFTLILIIALIINIVVIGCLYFGIDSIKEYFSAKSATYNEYIVISIFIIVSQSFFEIFAAISQSHLKAVIPAYFKELHLRVTSLLIVLLYAIQLYDLEFMMYAIGINYLLTCLIFCIIVSFQNNLTLRWPTEKIKLDSLKPILSLGGYFMLIGIGGATLLYSGQLITSRELGLEANGIFTTCLFIVAVIEMPRRVISQVTIPIISEYLNSGQMKSLDDLNKKVSLNMMIITSLIFLVIYFCVDDLFLAIPKGDSFKTGVVVIIVAGIGKLLGMTFGVSAEIFMYSKLKKWNILLLIISSVATIVLTTLFVRNYGIMGAALALAIIQLFNHISRALWINRAFGVIPIRLSHFKVLIPVTLTIIPLWLIPIEFHPYLNIVIKTALIGIVFLSITVILKISEDINNLATLALEKTKALFR